MSSQTPTRRDEVASRWAATELSHDLDLERLAQRVVEAVTEVTDFTVATLTVRHGDACRRIAAAGVEDARIGLSTPYTSWQALLEEDFRRRTSCFVIPPQASDTDWVQRVPIPDRDVGDGRETWTSAHGLIVELLDDDGERIGFLSVDAPRSGRVPDDGELEHLELFARQAQAALRNARLHEEVRRQRDAAEALNVVVQAVSGSLELEDVLRVCCDAVVEHSVGDRVSIYLYDADIDRFRTVMSRGVEPDPELWEAFRNLPPIGTDDVPIFDRAVRHGEPVLIEHVTTDHVRERELELFSLKSLAVYPMRWANETVAVLVVDTFREHVAFPGFEVELVGRIAAQAAVAIHQAQLHATARASAARADELYELTKQMTRTFDFTTVFERIVDAVTSRTDAYSVGLMELVGDEIRLLRSNMHEEVGPLPYERVSLEKLPPDFTSRLVAQGAIRIPDVQTSWLADLARPRARALLLAGHSEGDRLGLVLHVTSERRGAFSRDDAAFVAGLVEVAALALRNARLYEEARHNAERDGLTGLKNRRMYGIEVPALLQDADAESPVALAVLDVDDFKAVNDRHGHAAGDAALVHVADRIQRAIREVDHAYRLGGEEFAVAMPDASAEDARQVVERIRRGVAITRADVVAVTLSAGIAVAPEHGGDVDALFRTADSALYAAKADGKNAVRLAGEHAGSNPGPA